ncbi:ROK family protein [Alteracholeplasma palmae J233]|uniref:ROK family protein n=1 Tax=Alteracholeplasma palmae (strain ATCC 49389 / J233) TaxID=1318466 RepID=U4KL79_ALTPJ|nr:ROK family protein [Alteracholeplasma palmae]CCV64513.1 ROK family protein [Alteracholeplasma palmae J233]
MNLYLTFDIGGTDLKYGIITENETLLFQSITKTNGDLGSKVLIEKLKSIFQNLSTEYNIKGIAISTTSSINTQTTEVLTPSISIKNYLGLNFRDALKDLNLPISVQNDVKCMILCEKDFLPENKYKNILAITYGTGIGSALIIDNHLYHGFLYSAGECGKMMMYNSTYEGLASTNSLVKFAKKVYPHIQNGIDVFSLYDINDEKIVPIVNKFYDNLTTGLANMIYILNPDHIIIGGGITNRGTQFLNEVYSALEPKLWDYFKGKISISLAKTKNNAGMIGAFKFYKSIFNTKNE